MGHTWAAAWKLRVRYDLNNVEWAGGICTKSNRWLTCHHNVWNKGGAGSLNVLEISPGSIDWIIRLCTLIKNRDF